MTLVILVTMALSGEGKHARAVTAAVIYPPPPTPTSTMTAIAQVHRRDSTRGSTRQNSHRITNDNQHKSGFHVGISPSPASSDPATTLDVRYGASHDTSINPNARQPVNTRSAK